RQAVFKQFLQHSETMGGMLSGRVPFDGEALAGHAEGLAELVEAPWDYFPEPGDSRQRNAALPDIWQQPDAWQQAIADYRQAVADLLAVTREGVDSPEQVAAPGAAVQQGCKGCHDGFRRGFHFPAGPHRVCRDGLPPASLVCYSPASARRASARSVSSQGKAVKVSPFTVIS